MAKIITAEYFATLTIDEKADMLWQHGTFLKEIIEYGKYRLHIHELHGFFVGIFYDVKENAIEKIEVLITNEDELLKGISYN